MCLAVTACKKDAAQEVAMAPDPRTADVVDLVEGFLTKARGEGQTKDLTTLSLDSAEWYIEAALNYELAEAWLECQQHLMDSVEFTLGHSGGEVGSADVWEVFLEVEASISSMIEPGMNHLVVADVKAAPLLSGQPGKVYVVIGYGYDKNVNANYGPNDYWYSGGLGVTHCGCGPNNGALGLCADKQIQARINMPIPLPSVNCFFTDVISRCVGVPADAMWQCDEFWSP